MAKGDFNRYRMVACRYFGMSPFLFDEACKRGEISMADVKLAVLCELHVTENPEQLYEFLHPGHKAEQDQAAADAKNAATFEWMLKGQEW